MRERNVNKKCLQCLAMFYHLYIVCSASVCIIQEVLRKASLSPEQRRHVYTALKEVCDNGLTELNLDLFNNLFRNIDSSFHLSILPKAQGNQICLHFL